MSFVKQPRDNKHQLRLYLKSRHNHSQDSNICKVNECDSDYLCCAHHRCSHRLCTIIKGINVPLPDTPCQTKVYTKVYCLLTTTKAENQVESALLLDVVVT